MRRPGPVVLAALLCGAGFVLAASARQLPPLGGTDALAADLAARRAVTAAAIGPGAALVLWSASPRVYSRDMNYEYRQESNLLYLTGIPQPETMLVLTPGRDPDAHVFIQAADPDRELWEGRVLTPARAAAISGIADVRPERGTEAFDRFMAGLLDPPPSDGGDPADGGVRRLFVLGPLGDGATSDPDPDAAARQQWVTAVRTRHPDVQVESITDRIERQRAIKTPYEQRVLRRSVAISAAAHVAGMRATRPGAWEYEVEAAIEYVFHREGALSWGYPSIVASGPNALSLHYVQSTRRMEDGDLLLVDAAGDFQGLTGDITRTYPVNGRFTPEQRALYDLVLRALEAGTEAARPGAPVTSITRAVRATLGAGLLRLGLVTDPDAATGDSPQIGLWFPHGPTHGIGVDVHDPLFSLDPGAAFVIEPGLYIRPEVLARLDADPATQALGAALRPVVERYLGIGIRIEDSFLMRPDGPERLSAGVPRDPEAVEALVGTAD